MLPNQFTKLAVILILLSSSLYAQIDSTKASQGVNINFFNGYAISYKWNANQDMSYRIYLSLSSSWTDYQNEHESTNNSISNINSDETGNEIYISMNLSYQFIFNLITKETYRFYLGAGPSIIYGYNKYSSKNTNNQTGLSYNKSSNSNNQFGIGIITLTGIEAFLTNTISLYAEAHLRGSKSWSTWKGENSSFSENYDSNNNTSISDRNSWNANLELVKVGLGIYF